MQRDKTNSHRAGNPKASSGRKILVLQRELGKAYPGPVGTRHNRRAQGTAALAGVPPADAASLLRGRGFLSTIFLVPKKDGGQRPVINLKSLNKFVHTEHFKMEGIHILRDLLKAGIGWQKWT